MPAQARLSWFLATTSCITGCSYHAFSPPTRVVPLESPQVLPQARHSVAAQVIDTGAVWGPSFLGAAVRYRRGLWDKLEGSAEASLLHVTKQPDDVDIWPQGYSVRGGLKFQPLDWVALGVGVGGGGSAFGGFVSPDIGLVVGYENPYIVPFIEGRAFISQPIGARSLYVGQDDGETRYTKPQTTWGLAAGLGLRVPLQHVEPVGHSLLLGVSLTDVFDRERREGFLAASVGVDIVL